jgi:hypothetical protein
VSRDSGLKIREVALKVRKFENLRTSHRYKHHKEAWKAMVRRAMEKVFLFLSFFLFLLFSNTTRGLERYGQARLFKVFVPFFCLCFCFVFKHHKAAWKTMGKRA